MVERLSAKTVDLADARRWRVSIHLKMCPLCESLNSIQNRECITCGWGGSFDHDPAAIESSFVDLVAKCPSLVDAFPEFGPARGMSLRVRVRKFWNRLFRRRRLDLKA